MPSFQQQIALLGGGHGGRQALMAALAPRLQGTPLVLRAIEDGSELRSPALVLLLASPDGEDDEQELRWRGWLIRSGIGFSVLHGDAQARLEGAWRLIAPLLGLVPTQEDTASTGTAARWKWSCDKCSDPACEHRLFQDLLEGRRQGTPGAGY